MKDRSIELREEGLSYTEMRIFLKILLKVLQTLMVSLKQKDKEIWAFVNLPEAISQPAGRKKKILFR